MDQDGTDRRSGEIDKHHSYEYGHNMKITMTNCISNRDRRVYVRLDDLYRLSSDEKHMQTTYERTVASMAHLHGEICCLLKRHKQSSSKEHFKDYFMCLHPGDNYLVREYALRDDCHSSG